MSIQDDLKQSSNLLDYYGAERLGEGDINAGTNVLVAAALALANLLPPGFNRRANFAPVAFGANSMTVGSATSTLVTAQVVDKIHKCQNRLADHVRHYRELTKRRQLHHERYGHTSVPDVSPTQYHEMSIIDNLHGDNASAGLRDAAIGELLRPLDRTCEQELIDYPRLSGTARVPSEVNTILSEAHDARAFIHIPVRREDQFTRFEDPAHSIMDGYQQAKSMRDGTGFLMVTDPDQVVRGWAAANNSSFGWLSRLVLLADQAVVGDQALSFRAGTASGNSMDIIIESAIRRVFSLRLEKRLHATWQSRFEVPSLPDFQTPWMKFLATLESDCPGIWEALRALPASMIAGLCAFNKPLVPMDPAHFEGIPALCRMIARRMVAARGNMVAGGAKDRKAKIREGILLRLRERPHKPAELSRRFNSVSTPQVFAELEQLQSSGRVKRDGNWWMPSENSGSN